MNTKERLFALLEARQGSFVSGEELAGSLHLSRAAARNAIIQMAIHDELFYRMAVKKERRPDGSRIRVSGMDSRVRQVNITVNRRTQTVPRRIPSS